MDYIDGKPVYANRRTRKALREVEEYERGERELERYKPIKSRNEIGGKDYLYDIIQTSAFRRDLKLMKKRGADLSLLVRAIDILGNGGILPPSYKDHPLHGNWEGRRECHIKPDWIFIYSINENQLKLFAIRTGTHSDIIDR